LENSATCGTRGSGKARRCCHQSLQKSRFDPRRTVGPGR
jgi:hypothetical protein